MRQQLPTLVTFMLTHINERQIRCFARILLTKGEGTVLSEDFRIRLSQRNLRAPARRRRRAVKQTIRRCDYIHNPASSGDVDVYDETFFTY